MNWWQRGYVGIVIAVCVAVLPLPAPTQAAKSYRTLYVGHLIEGERYEYSYVYQDEITHHAFTFDTAAGDVLTLATQWITDPPPAGYGDPWQPVLIITPGMPPVGPGEGFVWDWDTDFHDGRLLPNDGHNREKPTLVDWEVPTTGTYTLYAKFYPYQQSSGGTYSIGFTQSASAPPPEGWTGESPQLEDGDQSLTTPIVYAVLFHSPTCKYSQAVINEFLPPLKEEYGDQLQVLYIDVSTAEGLALFQATGSALAPNHVAFSSVITPTLITGDTILSGGGEIAEQLPGLIRDGVAAGGVDLPPVPGLREAYEATLEHWNSDDAASGAVENAAAQPEASTSSDVPLVAQDDSDCDPDAVLDWLIRRQAWRNASGDAWISDMTATQVALTLHEHMQAIAELERPACADGVMLWTYYYYDAMGQDLLCYDEGQIGCEERYEERSATYVEHVARALSPLEELTGFTVEKYLDLRPEDLTAGAMGTVTSAAQQVDLSNLETVDYAAIAAGIPPAVDPQRIQQAGNNGAGLPASLTYEFEPEEIAPGVFVDTAAIWELSETTIRRTLSWEFRNEGGRTEPVAFIADIPKEFASSASEIAFSVPPTEIIEDDPVVRWLLAMDGIMQRRINASSGRLMTISHPDNTLALIEGFQQHLELINLRRQFQSCQRASGNVLDEEICALTVILQNSQHFNHKICDSLGRITDEGDRAMNVVIRNACRNLLQPYDNLHCDFDETVNRNACLTLTRIVLATSCEGLNGVDRNLCLYDVAAYVGDMRGCYIVEDADMAQDCRAQLSGDPAYCADITDAARHEACCAIFQADAAQYAVCMGEQEEGSEVIIEGDTLTLDEVLGTGDADADGSTFGPLPAAPNLGYLMNDAFYAEYACEGETEHARFIASGGQFFYAGDDERSFPFPANLTIAMTEQDHDQFAMSSAFVLGSLGLWMPLDGSTYSLPAVTEVWATDAESYNRYTALDLRPSPDTLTVAGNTLDAIRYEGSYSSEVVNDNRDSTFVDGYYSSIDSIAFRSWYDQRTGLLLKSHFQRQPVDCYREGDYADHECPEPIDLACTLVDTSALIGR